MVRLCGLSLADTDVAAASLRSPRSCEALPIGNGACTNEFGRLANPHNGVALPEQALKGLGFEVVKSTRRWTAS
jgi:hypothetical protein